MYQQLEDFIPVTESGCWIFTGKISPTGYGRFFTNGQQFAAHRASYESRFGKIPTGLHVLHKCDVTSCINPNHLFLGTNRDNVADRVKKGRTKTGIGEANRHAKLTRKDVQDIRASTARNRWLATKYGVDENTICSIKKHKIWKCIKSGVVNKPRAKSALDMSPTWEIRAKYTAEDDAFILENYRKLGSFECAERVNKTFRSVRNRAHVLGIARKYSAKTSATARADTE